MSTIDDGGPAFPVSDMASASPMTISESVSLARGMSLRDYFAAKVMQGFCADHTRDQLKNPSSLAIFAYELADAMLTARAK